MVDSSVLINQGHALKRALRFHGVPPSFSPFFVCLPFFFFSSLLSSLPSLLTFVSSLSLFLSFFPPLFLFPVRCAHNCCYLISCILDEISHRFKCLSPTTTVIGFNTPTCFGSKLQPSILVARCGWLQFASVTCRSFKTSREIKSEMNLCVRGGCAENVQCRVYS